ncbi:hypothetical protein [Bradyrhizobium sp.]|uniref:hypothetical protein n=1 Tax=Bradyrhizobium sp. TaxID=376 RepID=UPI001E132954|nr:hypothetical protein [Bradyrhizobium sp.]MBV8697197.1 hypothetical protein [Bradyrhizobium sp.]MBV8919607.1 hypothetical protein [Bradyrhizobium sp.]MBV9983465.1 hypothetical protein [Bradyrhizobium sp.]
MTPACGIDFGTSNSSVGVCDADGPSLLPIQRGATSVPTALFFSFDDHSTTFGHEATPEAVSAVFLTGGATRMPSVRTTIAAAVPAARLIAGDAFGSVATGLALDAAKRFA